MVGIGEEQESRFWIKSLRSFFSKSQPPSAGDGRGAGRDQRSLAAAPDVRASMHADGIALLHISTGRVFLCNRTGSRIWEGVVAGLNADAISEQISRECGVGWDLVRRHTSIFLNELESRGLVIRTVDQSC
jgi:coenzyme PQQ synthesis protein D (PqqD)